MRIRCDLCESELHADRAVVIADAKRVHFFCSSVCAADCGFRETRADPGSDDDEAARRESSQ